MSITRLAMLGCAPLVLGAAGQGEKAHVKTWIEVEQGAAGQQRFVAYLSSDERFAGQYELVGEKRGAGGTSVVRQGGRVAAEPGRPTRLSQMSFGGTSADKYSIRLKIFVGGKLVGEAESGS